MGQLQTVTLDAAYRHSRRINAHYGRTYFLATRMLPADRRPAVHALYAFARVADEIVDSPGAAPERELDRLAAELRLTLAGSPGAPGSPVLIALADTVRRYGIRPALFTEFLASMRMDLTVTDYATFDELAGYTHGSAGVIGLQMLPVLGTVGPLAEAEPAAAALGEAFQLTNFLRDVGEDLERGRVYIPQEDLHRFKADPWQRTVDDSWRRLMRFEIARARELYSSAQGGVELLPPASRRCVGAARVLYSRILEVIERRDYDVFGRRATVPLPTKLAVVAAGFVNGGAYRG